MSMARLLGRISNRLAETGLHPQGLSAVSDLLWRAVLLGSILYLTLGSEPAANLKLNAMAYMVAVIWSYYDGVFVKRMWSIAWLEAIFLHLAAVQVGSLLALLFGNPV